jgi:23S rRNA (cytidine1920-2'-O)/16S rRNA (cytidine1409-2'-O)-methyltransferase
VRVDGRLVTKAGTAVPGEAELEVDTGPTYVSRGGDKLATALAAFGVDVAGLVCLDVGASTGGFTDCLLQAGAAHVTALDVGRGQLHERLRHDDRVTLLEGVNARLLAPGDLPGPAATLAVVDVSFISLSLVLPPLAGVLARPYRLLPLVKPQFEAGRAETKRGVVRDAAVHMAVLERVALAAEEAGGVVLGACESGHPGPAGNREFFLDVVSSDHPDAAGAPADPLPLLRDAVA